MHKDADSRGPTYRPKAEPQWKRPEQNPPKSKKTQTLNPNNPKAQTLKPNNPKAKPCACPT